MGKAPKTSASGSRKPPPLSPGALKRALLQRVDERLAATGAITLPAVPALLEYFLEIVVSSFHALGRDFGISEREHARSTLAQQLTVAFTASQRSKVVVRFEAEPGCALGYEVRTEVRSVADAYERWIGTSDQPLFGTHPDARVWSLAQCAAHPERHPVLDLGAGTGRNALALARRGHPVHAVEITPKFAELIEKAAQAEKLPVQVLVCDALHDRSALSRDYQLVIASEVAPDFRSTDDLRHLLQMGEEVLAEGGLLVFNLHLTAPGYTPDRATREYAQQCYSALFTQAEVLTALEGLRLELLSSDSVHDFELANLPADAWPPTPWFVNWSQGLDVLETERAACPIELRWLVFRKVSAVPGPDVTAAQQLLSQWSQIGATARSRPKTYDAAALRKALLSRVRRRWFAGGTLTFPAVPALAEHMAHRCSLLFDALGRSPSAAQAQDLRSRLQEVLDGASAASQHSNVLISYDAPMGTELHYAMTFDAQSVSAMYEDWLQRFSSSPFGEHADARLINCLKEYPLPPGAAVLDVGAGDGRNALYLAARGYDVCAVEASSLLAERMRALSIQRGLAVGVVNQDLFEALTNDHRTYALALLSGVASDFRALMQLAECLRLIRLRLVPGGYLLLNVHLARDPYVPDAAAQQWAQHNCATPFTSAALGEVAQRAGFSLLDEQPVYAYEAAHLPEPAFPPTPGFAEWATCQHLFALPAEACPIALTWQLYRAT